LTQEEIDPVLDTGCDFGCYIALFFHTPHLMRSLC